ncbi:hypothetical protein RhiirC2_758353 [Rhizophagus irregularis]|uniref:Uncharacterized protein n=1 Tax=Rhizophagus irregularis TaxID=588596 RepID=A0A2N1MP20_9GLOM|nr:hypothetical protein RhiirC2_758353 [Rhizophagus irregularis]
MPLCASVKKNIYIIKIVVPKRLICSPLLFIGLECTFKLRQILILILRGFLSVIHRRSSRLLIA